MAGRDTVPRLREQIPEEEDRLAALTSRFEIVQTSWRVANEDVRDKNRALEDAIMEQLKLLEDERSERAKITSQVQEKRAREIALLEKRLTLEEETLLREKDPNVNDPMISSLLYGTEM